MKVAVLCSVVLSEFLLNRSQQRLGIGQNWSDTLYTQQPRHLQNLLEIQCKRCVQKKNLLSNIVKVCEGMTIWMHVLYWGSIGLLSLLCS